MKVHTEHALPVAGPVSVPGVTAGLCCKAEMQRLRRMNGCRVVTLLACQSPSREAGSDTQQPRELRRVSDWPASLRTIARKSWPSQG